MTSHAGHWLMVEGRHFKGSGKRVQARGGAQKGNAMSIMRFLDSDTSACWISGVFVFGIFFFFFFLTDRPSFSRNVEFDQQPRGLGILFNIHFSQRLLFWQQALHQTYILIKLDVLIRNENHSVVDRNLCIWSMAPNLHCYLLLVAFTAGQSFIVEGKGWTSYRHPKI